MRRLFVTVLLLWSAMAATAQARDRWVLVGTRDVDLAKGSDSIDVSEARGSFRGIRVEAKRQPVDLTKVKVIFGDGSAHDEDRLIHLLKGERSKPIGLSETDRFLERVDVT